VAVVSAVNEAGEARAATVLKATAETVAIAVTGAGLTGVVPMDRPKLSWKS
jgi:hypothetical protein